MIDWTAAGMHVRGTPLYLDATSPTELSFISHAHADHLARHRQSIGTAATLELAALRGAQPLVALPTPFRHPFVVGTTQLELFPAGHVLGSAQLRITLGDQRIVYTGDLNPIPSLTVEPLEVAPCDLLVIESTFGLPRFRFPPRAETYERMAEFARSALLEGRAPVFLAYALGKAQEAIKALSDAGFAVAVHPSIAAICEVYGRYGFPLEYRSFRGTLHEEEVLILPPSFDRAEAELLLPKKRTAFLTGWALEPGARFRYGVDEVLPLSDHGDFAALLDYISRTGAKKIQTVHGFDQQLAACLRDRGFDAQPLQLPKQRELF